MQGFSAYIQKNVLFFLILNPLDSTNKTISSKVFKVEPYINNSANILQNNFIFLVKNGEFKMKVVFTKKWGEED